MAKNIKIQTAGGVVKATLSWNPAWSNKFRARYGKGGPVQKFVDQTIVREMEPYYPMDQKFLYDSTQSLTVIGSGIIVVGTPYGRYQYYGISKSGNSNFVYKNNQSGKRGKSWFERWKSDNKESFVNRVQDYARDLEGG